MNIDQNDGTVSLPNGFSVSPSLTQDAFQQASVFRTARAQDCGTPPWIHYHFTGGRIDDRELLVSLCFYDQILVEVRLTASLYAANATWADYSLDIEAATKDYHERMLERMFGQSTRSNRDSVKHSSSSQSILAHPVVWQFRWGEVASRHDSRGGATFISIEYGDRKEDACKAYLSGRRGSE